MTLGRGGKFATFVAQFDAGLIQTKTVKLDSGAFWTGSNAKLDGQHLLVAGQFLPNAGSSAGREAFAASKVDLGSSKYTWSNYACPADTQQAASIFAPDGSTYTASLTATNLAISVVDRMGKTVDSFSVRKPLCGIEALALDNHVLKAIGTSCKQESSSVIAAIDLADKTAVVVRQLDVDVSAPQFDGQSWVGIVATKDKRQGTRAQRSIKRRSWRIRTVYPSILDSLRDRQKFLKDNPRYTRAGLYNDDVKGNLV